MNASLCSRPITRSSLWKAVVVVNRGSIEAGVPRLVFQNHFDLQTRQTLGRRLIHHTPSLSAIRKIGKRPRRAADFENDLPPSSILQTAYKSETLPIAPEKVLDFLREFQTQSSVHTPGWERKVCLDHDIDPWILGLIAGILDKCEGPGQRGFGRGLLFTAASFGDRASNFKLVYAAIVQGRLRDVTEPLEHVGLLANRGNDPQAMSLLGMALYSQQKEQEALTWLRKASAGALDFPGAADALVLEGRILMSHDTVGATAALQRAAEELDDPNAYFYLSKLQAPGSANHEAYLIKAATSGVVEACHNLGAIEMVKINKGGKTPKSLDDYGLARDWTEVAAEGGFGLSMLNMALMCRTVGQREQAVGWLEKAEEEASVREEAQVLRERWESEDMMRD